MLAKLRIPTFEPVLWTTKASFVIDLLLGAQFLILNSFAEPLCKQAKSVLKAIFD